MVDVQAVRQFFARLGAAVRQVLRHQLLAGGIAAVVAVAAFVGYLTIDVLPPGIVSFTPHLLPVRRGLLATCNVRSTGPDLRALLEEHYAASPVVTVLPEGVVPELARVQHTDGAEIGVFDDRHTDRTIVICALDNLGKGAAGQAVQNVNLLYGLHETAGLRHASVLV